MTGNSIVLGLLLAGLLGPTVAVLVAGLLRLAVEDSSAGESNG